MRAYQAVLGRLVRSALKIFFLSATGIVSVPEKPYYTYNQAVG